jgi:D-lactate dehydrogenase
MKVAVFDTHRFERETLDSENRRYGHRLSYFDCRLSRQSADLAKGFEAVCCFVNDHLDAATLQRLKELGIRLVALRSAGYNNVDVDAATQQQIPVVRVPEYSPFAVAEHAVALMLTLNRKIHRAYTRVRELNFSLEGLVGFDMAGKTVGVIGTGRIGRVLVKIMNGFGCRVLAYDVAPAEDLIRSGQSEYVDLENLLRKSDIISLHVPLNAGTRHLIDEAAFGLMKPEVLLINTGRGGLVETHALIRALKAHRIGGAGLDVYEEEEDVFFQDLSNEGISDDVLARLLTFPNVVITSHQAFLTREALTNIAITTLMNLTQFEKGQDLTNRVLSV